MGNRSGAVRVRLEAEVPGRGLVMSLCQTDTAYEGVDVWSQVAGLAGEVLREALLNLLDRELVDEERAEEVQQRVVQPLGSFVAAAGDDDDEPCDGGAQWGMVLQFDTDSPQFCRGFEVGQIWAATENGFTWEGLIHAVNAEMVMRVAEARGLPFSGELAGDDGAWMQVRLG